MTDMQMWNKPGFSLPPKRETNYNAIEKQLIEIQFQIFDHYGDDISNNLQLLNEQYKYLQVAAFQCELKIFKSYFDNLERLVLARLNDKDSKLKPTDRISLASIYASQQLQRVSHPDGKHNRSLSVV